MDVWKKNLTYPKVESTKAKTVKSVMPFALSSKKWKQYYDTKEYLKKENSEIIQRRKDERKRKAEDKLKAKQQKKRKTETFSSSENIQIPSTEIQKKKMHKKTDAKRKMRTQNTKRLQRKASTTTTDLGEKHNQPESINLYSEGIKATEEVIKATDEGTEYNIGDFVIVDYAGEKYPGIIEAKDGDEEYEVSTMVATNKERNTWKWPKIPDKIWYTKRKVVRKIKNPTRNLNFQLNSEFVITL